MRQPVKTIDQIENEIEGKHEDRRTEPKTPEFQRLPNGLYSIKFNAGGELPDELKGMFTSVARAQVAIDKYNSSRTTA